MQDTEIQQQERRQLDRKSQRRGRSRQLHVLGCQRDKGRWKHSGHEEKDRSSQLYLQQTLQDMDSYGYWKKDQGFPLQEPGLISTSVWMRNLETDQGGRKQA